MDKVTKEFKKLVAQGKINKAKKVKDTKVDYFKAGIHKVIKYNIQMNELTKEDIDFCLLHEEGHYNNPIKLIDRICFAIPFLLICIIGLFDNIIPVNIRFISGLMSMLFLLYFIHVWLIEVHQKYEYLADDYACKNIDNPRDRILALKRLPKIKKNKWIKYLSITVGTDYLHPSNEDRINRIKKNF